jgi:hypothetical protein
MLWSEVLRGRAPRICMLSPQRRSRRRTRKRPSHVAFGCRRRTAPVHVWFAYGPAKSGVIAFAAVHAADSAYVLYCPYCTYPRGLQRRENGEWFATGALSGALSRARHGVGGQVGRGAFTRQAHGRQLARRRAAMAQTWPMMGSNGWFLFEGEAFTCFSAWGRAAKPQSGRGLAQCFGYTSPP